MKGFITLLALVFGALCSAQAGSERLIGSWKSDKESTLSYLKAHTSLSGAQLDRLSPSLGKMVLTFDSQTMKAQSGDWKFSSPYKIVQETKETITIEALDPNSKKLTKTVIELDARGFWSPDERIKGYKERFNKQADK